MIRQNEETSSSMAFWVAASAVLILDRATKLVITRHLDLGRSIPVIRGYFQISYVRNPGGAFGFLPGGRTFFLLASIIAVGGIIAYKSRRGPQKPLTDLSLGLILGGAAGNLIDRLLYGSVVDWLDFKIWPVFNIADAALVVGLGLFSLEIIRSNRSA